VIASTTDICANHQAKRTCSGGKLSGDTNFHYSSCINMSSLPGRSIGGPDVISLKDGSILALRQDPDRQITNKDGTSTLERIITFQSLDGALTWQPLSIFVSTTTAQRGSHFLGNMSTKQLKSGRLITAYRSHTKENNSTSQNEWDWFILRTKISDDNGKTWQEWGIIDRRTGVGNLGTWEPHIVEPSKRPGILQAYFAAERPASLKCPNDSSVAQDIVLAESKDGGATWKTVGPVISRGVSREGVPSVVELKDGSLLAAFETFKDGSCGSKSRQIIPGLAHSNDGGLTWKYLPSADSYTVAGAHQGWAHIIGLADGRVLLKNAPNVAHLETLSDPLWSEHGGERDIEFRVSTNVPTFGNPPIWSEVRTLALEGARWGHMSQLGTGDVIVVGNDYNWLQTKIRVVPLTELK
jgi:hypothetical protein